MCGIFGATDKERFKSLYNLNKQRGNFSFGCCFLTQDRRSQYCESAPGEVNLDDLMSDNYYYLLGHTQAPTSSARGYDRATSHPFVDGDWVVAHNGVLSNFETLKQKYVPEHANPVDSSIIPVLLSCMQEDDEIQTIKNVLEAIEGTYSLWLLNHVSKNIYVVRCGSTHYGDLIKCEFSSYPDIGLSELDDNALYLVTQEGLTKVSGFDGNSPFFII